MSSAFYDSRRPVGWCFIDVTTNSSRILRLWGNRPAADRSAAERYRDLLFVIDMHGEHGRDVAEFAEDLGDVVDAADSDAVARPLRGCAGITTFSDPSC